MISRFYWLGNQDDAKAVLEAGNYSDSLPTSRRKRYLKGWLILGGLSLLFILWMGYRWIVQPTWPAALPELIREILSLAQLAAFLTLIFLWAALYWRHRQRNVPSRIRSLTVDQLYNLDPKAFERYVAGLFRQKGYRVVLRGRSGDHGVDLELSGPNNRRAVVQCKRYQNTVGEEIVRDLYGTLMHERASRAFLVTTAEISDAAREWAHDKPITLIDGETLVHIASTLAGDQRKL